MNVLELVRMMCGATGIQQPTSLIGTSDLQTIQLRELLNEEGTELASRSASGWQALIGEKTFTTIADQDQGLLVGGSILSAADNYRTILNETLWNRSKRIPVFGPRAPRVWQGFKALTFAGPFGEYRIRGGHLLIMPTPAAGETIAFEFVTRNWLTSSDGSESRAIIEDDEDVPLLDEEVLRAGLRWRWKRNKGLDYSEEFSAYESRVIDALARDGTKARLSLGGDTLADSRVPVAIPRLIGVE